MSESHNLLLLLDVEVDDVNVVYEKLCSAILGAARKSIPRTNGKQKFRNKSPKELVKLRSKARK